MSVHLIKLCVGVENLEHLRDIQGLRMQQALAASGGMRLLHVTRNRPRRADELCAGGSIYWVIKRLVRARQRILACETVTGPDGGPRCALVLDPQLVATRPHPHRPFQGWRYLKPADAPVDLASGEAAGELPAQMAAALRNLGLI